MCIGNYSSSPEVLLRYLNTKALICVKMELLLLLLHIHHLMLMLQVMPWHLLVEGVVSIVKFPGSLKALHLRCTERVGEIPAGLWREVDKTVVGIAKGKVFFPVVLRRILERRGVCAFERI